jgi:hypothetical protein
MRKLNLEVEKLEQDTGTEGRLRPFVPLVSVALALVTGAIGLRRYRRERRQERQLRIEAETAANLDQLVTSPLTPESSGAKSVSALRNLAGLTAQPDAPEDHASRVTQTVMAIVKEDLARFDSINKARFPVTCLTHWPPYAEVIAADQAQCQTVVDRYLDTLADVQGRAAIYVANLRLDESGRYSSMSGTITPTDRLLFECALEGVGRYVAYLSNAVRDTAREQLKLATNNRALANSVATRYAHE